MARNFKELRDKMSPQSQARSKAKARQLMAEMVLAEIRRESDMTQSELAKAMGVSQPALSKLESQDDMQISTLRRLIHALGGELEMVVKLPDRTVKLASFCKEASRAS